VTLADDLNDAVTATFGWNGLKPYQLDAITSLLGGRDVLAVMSTGSGKSALYQVPALKLDGVVLVISPLIALQFDQVSALEHTDAPLAVALNSRQKAAETREAWAALEAGTAGYLYLGPEQLTKPEVLKRLATVCISLVAVDEAHCISAWGHDFRPDYLRIPDALDQLGRPPTVALTATASPILRDEIIERLRLRDPRKVVGGFDRPNIELEVRHVVDDDTKRRAVVETVGELEGPGLVYCATRKDAEFYADELGKRGVSAQAYHAGLRSAERDEIHQRFHDDHVAVVAATSAFGMGIDKPNVRFVVHASVPDSVDSYYQQIGRAGRDGDPARAVLFYRPEDLGLGTLFATTHLDEDLVRNIVSAAGPDAPTKLTELRDKLGVRGRALTRTVNLLEKAAVVTVGRCGIRTDGSGPDDAVHRAREAAASAERVDRTRVDMLRAYAETLRCRRQHLLAYFGDHLDGPCGNCDRCRADDPPPDGESAIPVQTHVDHREWGSGVVLDGDEDRITVLFDDYGYRTLSMQAVREQDLLTVHPAHDG
jgi:ATP-dependent DNA helicase RecQ